MAAKEKLKVVIHDWAGGRTRAGSWTMLTFSVSLLAGCTLAPKPQPVAVQPPQELPALALLKAESKGYAEGFAAGKRVQARRDAEAAKLQALAAAEAPNPPSAATAPVTPVTPATPVLAATPAAPAVATPTVDPVLPPQSLYTPTGPAVRVALPASASCAAQGSTAIQKSSC